ncbi:MAG: glutamate--tRNA ligase [Candidatus Pacebacteria bacterium]|nr:glutamate--tRNA ligase [Candidatus Paceibacterota bacterium]
MEKINKKIITRFAPSPTGFMHVGGVRTALYAWAYAKKNNGTFILRIEDTDKEREVPGSIKHIFESLKWLGINWDEGPDIGGENGPYIQSERLDIYKKYAQILIDKGLAYADPYTEKEVEEFRQQAETLKKPFLYRDFRPQNPPIWDGTKPLRFKVNNIKRYEWEDLVFGKLSAGEEALDDFILIKSDGYPTYNFAHIVDDLEMGVTHVMRGQEFISSTPKFLSLYEALDFKPPFFVTLPPIMGDDGKKKLGKRDGAKDVLEYKKEGYLPEAMINFLAFIGWNPGGDQEILTREEFINLFDISQIGHSGGRFNEEKLDWINREHLKKYSQFDQIEYVKKFISQQDDKLIINNEEIISKITPLVMERISKGKEIMEMVSLGDLDYFFKKPILDKNLIFFKTSKLKEEEKDKKISIYLGELISLLESIDSFDFNKDKIREVVWPYAEEVGRGDLLWPFRYGLSGKEKSPDPFVLSEILGKEETILRIKSTIQILSQI